MNATAAALECQQDLIATDNQARSITAVLEMLRHWLREAEMMLPTGRPIPAADRYQANLIAAYLRPMGADICLGETDSHITLLNITLLNIAVRSDRGGLELLKAWAQAAEVTLIHISRASLQRRQQGKMA